MFNKEGVPFFVIMIPFLSIIFSAFFITSYYLKLSNERFDNNLLMLERHAPVNMFSAEALKNIAKEKAFIKQESEATFIDFVVTLTGCILFSLVLFTVMMRIIIRDIIKKYVNKVAQKEQSLKELNESLAQKVAQGIEEAKQKDRAMFQQAKLARMGSMMSMIAHQWRQPLSELSGVLMELELASRFKEVSKKHLEGSLERSNNLIEFMSKTIDDFRNFYKPDKTKEDFFLSTACKRALSLVDAALKNSNVNLYLNIQNDRKVHGYPTEFAQAILSIVTNAKDALNQREIKNANILVEVYEQAGQGFVCIEDNAGGISNEHLESIFEPYFSTKEQSKGTGLGLYMSKLIIEQNMQGSLSVENAKAGARFCIAVKGV